MQIISDIFKSYTNMSIDLTSLLEKEIFENRKKIILLKNYIYLYLERMSRLLKDEIYCDRYSVTMKDLDTDMDVISIIVYKTLNPATIKIKSEIYKNIFIYQHFFIFKNIFNDIYHYIRGTPQIKQSSILLHSFCAYKFEESFFCTTPFEIMASILKDYDRENPTKIKIYERENNDYIFYYKTRGCETTYNSSHLFDVRNFKNVWREQKGGYLYKKMKYMEKIKNMLLKF
jgi:hypothetical protein